MARTGRRKARKVEQRSVAVGAAPQPHAPRAGAGVVRFVVCAAAWMAAFYGLYYYPHASDSLPGTLIAGLLDAQGHAASALIAAFEPGVHYDAGTVVGRFPMRVVKACGALDAQALFAAAVLAFRASPRAKLVGVLLGSLAIMAVNVLRLVVLYFVGADMPRMFDTMHEELMPLALVVAACAGFSAWSMWVAPPATDRAHA
jgi:exosortase/archaeosortase family protein